MYAHVPKDEHQKLDSKTRECVFLGYSTETKGYRLYDMNHERVFFSRDVIFNELDTGVLETKEMNEPKVVELELGEGETPRITLMSQTATTTMFPLSLYSGDLNATGEVQTGLEIKLCLLLLVNSPVHQVQQKHSRVQKELNGKVQWKEKSSPCNPMESGISSNHRRARQC